MPYQFPRPRGPPYNALTAPASGLDGANTRHPDIMPIPIALSNSELAKFHRRIRGVHIVSQLVLELQGNNPNVAEVMLASADVMDGEVCAIANALLENTKCTLFDGSCTAIGDDAMSALGDTLARNKALTALDLSENKYSARGVCSMAGGLVYNSTVTKLSMRGAKSLASRWAKSRT